MARSKAFDETATLEKAIELFWRQGFHGTSIQDLVDHLGINRASLYATFGDKESLYRRALSHYRNINTERAQCFLTAHPSAKTALRELLQRATAPPDKQNDPVGCFIVSASAELSQGSTEINEFLLLNQETFVGLFHSVLQRAVAEGEISADRNLPALANLLFTYYNGVKVLNQFNADPTPLQNATEELLKIFD
ncbi:TetR/AcrR family transcriptional regulator [Neolewinella lacunae]|uniref:TetR/AcrR family transcriptional regulator n=1 Tax=Neolewinella lacunae TaxID=1517758 RepID=A0A923PK05_9BACT|nr:TetR/AcrR family transcriptional regulator [Neolewinella lacunae]MBC6992613.1 TetR/AcrR family transcriptional regulator [Neolewinella lacunae]MDN3634354.1 TetR/AcrR family transcriptional regulator [Neolewinella lacunae]